MSLSPARSSSAPSWIGPVALSVGALALHTASGRVFLDGFVLDLGSVMLPAARQAVFMLHWAVFGGVAAAALAVGLARWAAPRSDRLASLWRAGDDGRWILYGSLVGLAIPLAVRTLVLRGAPIADDESSYRFMAELLASGRLYAESPPMKLFFDRTQMINDGKLYAQYFIGWPALMVPGVWLGATGVVASFYSALTVAPLFLVLRRLAGSVWARLGVVLFLAAPMVQIAAATELSHTACLFALAWLTWCGLVAIDRPAEGGGAPWWVHAGAATAFSVAFFVRPLSALGIGLPLLAAWAWGVWRSAPRRRVAAMVAFAVPATALAGAFLAVNAAQNGSPTLTAYERSLSYARENGFRFSAWRQDPGDITPNLQRPSPARAGAVVATGLLRLNHDLFGWPFSWAFVFFAGMGRRRAALAAGLALFLVLQGLSRDAGIDTFGPVHFFEAAWPILLLTVLGLRGLTRGAAAGVAAATDRRLIAPAAAAALIAVSLVGFLPVRLGALERVADTANLPLATAAGRVEGRAVIFTPTPWVPSCARRPTRSFVFFRPNNDPELENRLLWVNDLGPLENRRLMAEFPDRTGYVLSWGEGCRVTLTPLAEMPTETPREPPAGDS